MPNPHRPDTGMPHLCHDPLTPPVRVASFYGPHTMRRKRPCEPALDQLLRENSLIMGDFNAVTLAAHTTALKPNFWPWLITRERSGAATDLLLPYSQSVLFTRVRRYGGTKSYIDRAYGSRAFCALFKPTNASVLDFSAVHGAQDHDPGVIHTTPWATPHQTPPRCARWNRRDVQTFRRHISQLCADQPSPATISDTEHAYEQRTHRMLQVMQCVNDSKPDTPHWPHDVTDWASLVCQLAKQAKRRSKVFYCRIKHTLLTPPAQSSLPVPSRKIQRILQRNTPWSADAAHIIPQHPQLGDPPPQCLSCEPWPGEPEKSPLDQTGFPPTSCPSYPIESLP